MRTSNCATKLIFNIDIYFTNIWKHETAKWLNLQMMPVLWTLAMNSHERGGHHPWVSPWGTCGWCCGETGLVWDSWLWGYDEGAVGWETGWAGGEGWAPHLAGVQAGSSSSWYGCWPLPRCCSYGGSPHQAPHPASHCGAENHCCCAAWSSASSAGSHAGYLYPETYVTWVRLGTLNKENM